MAVATLLPRLSDVRTHLNLAFVPLHRLGTGQCQPSMRVDGVARDLRVKIASTREEWEQAFQLVADNYRARGYDASACDYRFTAHQALPDSVTLVAKDGDRVQATLSLVMDNRLLGLPLESIYGPEIGELRRSGRRVGEVTSLADTGLSSREFVAVLVALIRLAWQHHMRHGGDTAVITVNPRHSAFYTKVLGFVPLGGRRSHPSVRNHPAEAFLLDPDILKQNSPAMHGRIFGELLPNDVLRAFRMPVSLVRHFAGNSSQTDARLVEKILRTVETSGSPRRW